MLRWSTRLVVSLFTLALVSNACGGSGASEQQRDEIPASGGSAEIGGSRSAGPAAEAPSGGTTAETPSPAATTPASPRRCSDVDVVAIVPAALELAAALGRLVDPQVEETALLYRAATDVVALGTRVETAARQSRPCSPDARRAKELYAEAGARAAGVGLRLQDATDLAGSLAPRAVRRAVGRSEPELRTVAGLLRTADRLVAEPG